jgi:class 3 adenylate cyclase
MMEQPQATITTILFTDLVSSTDLMQRVGDEHAQRIFQTHHQLLADAVAQTGGEALQWLGDGLMAAFASTGDAVRCAVHMQQAAAQHVGGERLRIRVGLNAGEILRHGPGSGYFGTPVVVSRRLCDRAQAGQILSTGTVAGLLAGRQAFRFQPLGEWELKGMAAPVAVCEVLYDSKDALAALAKTPFVGRQAEIERLRRRLAQAKAASGSLVLLAGEPGIGKTRTAEELAEEARREGARILCGRCFEGDTTLPYGPLAEAFARYAKDADAAELPADLGVCFGRATGKGAGLWRAPTSPTRTAASTPW